MHFYKTSTLPFIKHCIFVYVIVVFDESSVYVMLY